MLFSRLKTGYNTSFAMRSVRFAWEIPAKEMRQAEMAEEKTNFGKRWKARFHRYCLAFIPNEPNAILLAVLLGIGLNTFLLYFIDLPKDTTLFEYLRDSKPWALITGLTAAPALVLMWYWRDKHRRADVRTARESQLTERFATAVRLLGDERMEIRLGGIYALERLARDSEADHWAVMETLSAFIRENARWEKSKEELEFDAFNVGKSPQKKKTPADNPKPRTDIQAILTVIGRRPEERRKYEEEREYNLDLSGTDLRGVDICKAFLKHINLENTSLALAKLSGANLSGAVFSGANLSGAELSGADLSRAMLSGTDLSGANLSGAVLSGANLSGAVLSGALLFFVDLSGISLFGVDLSGAVLYKANLVGANLYDANLTGAHLSGANFIDADLSRANLTDAVFTKAKYNSKTSKPKYEFPTLFPPDFDPKAHGMIDVTPDKEESEQKA